MNFDEFKKELGEINNKSWGFGNEILYLMAKEPKDLLDKEKLAGSIWLIGRAYAASPQRRSYGTTENNEGYININGETPKNRPIWPVRTQNDGREGFFDEIASKMISLISEEQPLISDQSTYKYDKSIEDYKKLTESIIAVLKYNLILSQALEAFDKVPEKTKLYCTNHISFSSKFLHFYFPNRVFIIDNFAREGGKLLFNGKGKKRALYNPPSDTSDVFDDEIYDKFEKKQLTDIYNGISNNAEIQTIIEEYNKRARDTTNTSNDNSTIKDYIEHTIRSYLLGCFLKEAKITPINLVRYNQQVQIMSMPRLTDAIFLNIKAPCSSNEEKHYDSIKNVYGIEY